MDLKLELQRSLLVDLLRKELGRHASTEVSITIQELNAKRSVYLTREGDRGKQQQHVNDLTCGDVRRRRVT